MVDEIRIDYNNIGKLSMLFDFGIREAVLLRKTAEPVYLRNIKVGVIEADGFKIMPQKAEYSDGKIEETAVIECNVGDSIFLHETSRSGRILDFEELRKHFKKLSEKYRAKNKEVSA